MVQYYFIMNLRVCDGPYRLVDMTTGSEGSLNRGITEKSDEIVVVAHSRQLWIHTTLDFRISSEIEDMRARIDTFVEGKIIRVSQPLDFTSLRRDAY